MASPAPARTLRARGPATLALLAALAVLAAEADLAAAKRGCSAFGHSCFGGHGKRSDEALPPLGGEVALVEEEPVPGAAAEAAAEAEAGAEEAAARLLAGLSARRPQPQPQLQQGLRLSPFLRQWLQNYQRSAAMQSVELQ